ncbi:MAG: hypothetical protein HC895_03795 [Leptolyngbyaceae cyanobacterium SM1_3_5]|nr:hypothetical protein [Leptolyngbyaceae cyanobacterium SM1_3_5]
MLIRILSNHIVPGSVSSSEIASIDLGSSIATGLTPPPGDFNPNDNVGNVDTSDSIRPNSGQSMSSPGGVGTVPQTEISGRPEATPGFDTPGNVQRGDANMSMDNMNMDSRDDNQAAEPPSGEQRPNENVANVQGETLSPRAIATPTTR